MLVLQPQEEQVGVKQLRLKQRLQLQRLKPVEEMLMKEGQQQDQEDQDLLSQKDQRLI